MLCSFSIQMIYQLSLIRLIMKQERYPIGKNKYRFGPGESEKSIFLRKNQNPKYSIDLIEGVLYLDN